MRIAIWIISIITIGAVVTGCGKKPPKAESAAKDTVAVVAPLAPPAPPKPPVPPAPKKRPAPKPEPRKQTVTKKGTIKEEDLPRYVQAFKPKIQRLYKQRRQVVPMQGSMRITVVFASNGDVKSATLEPDAESSFTKSFISEVEAIVKGWHLDVEKEMSYTFRMSFYE